MINSKGLVTFNNKYLDLSDAGSCQYLLARDFLNKDFSVVINFESFSKEKIKKSILFTDGTDQVEIKDYNVFINNRYTDNDDLPFIELKTISVELPGWDTLIIKHSSGVILRISLYDDILSLELSPIYAGRIMGLWGSLFTNEHDGDMIEPSGKVLFRYLIIISINYTLLFILK